MRGPIREEQRSTTNVVLCAPCALTIVRDQSELGTLLRSLPYHAHRHTTRTGDISSHNNIPSFITPRILMQITRNLLRRIGEKQVYRWKTALIAVPSRSSQVATSSCYGLLWRFFENRLHRTRTCDSRRYLLLWSSSRPSIQHA